MHVLVVEDDRTVADSLERGLARYGFHVTSVPTGRSALTAPAADMVLLDLGLPDMDGLDVCRELRARSDVPLIVISGRGSETEKVVGLELGADDYIVKPFLIRELIARMRAVLRRRPIGPCPPELTPGMSSVRPGRCQVSPPRPPRDMCGRVSVDRRAHRAFLDGTEIPLSPKEYALLAFLTERVDNLVTREDIMTAVWDSNWSGPTKTLDTHITALRHKLGDALCIQAVRGVGFRLGVRSDETSEVSAS
ncbi:response regulator transcription factor [Streptomyces sp. NPDC007896]|uniref:response regulator transcription factor n=1 Tax=Streptomyces sp. NPDC007896 TaxID=3364784 RepID=UPI0036E00CA4